MKKYLLSALILCLMCGVSFSAQIAPGETSSHASSTYVPYTGATGSATLGAYTIQATKVRAATFEGTGGGRIDGTTTLATMASVSLTSSGQTIEVVSGKDIKLWKGNIYTDGYYNYGATSSLVGFSGGTNSNIWVKKIGTTVTVTGSVEGLSNGTTLTFTVPYVNRNVTQGGIALACPVKYNGGFMDALGCITLPAGSNIVTGHRTGDQSTGNWTNDGMMKGVYFNFTYEAEPQ